MLSSKKLTFSLTSIIVLIAFGLVCFAPSAFADGDAKKTHFDLKVTVGAGESMIDVDVRGDAAKNIQIATGRDRASRVIHNVGEAADADAETLTISLFVEFTHVVNLAEPGALIPLEDIDETTTNEPKPSGGDFGADDLYVAAYDKEGRALGVLSLAEASAEGTSISQFRDTGGPGRQFLVRIDETQLRNAYIGRGATSGFEIYSLVFFIPKGLGADPGDTADAAATRGIRKYDRAHAIAHFGPGAHQHLNAASNEFQVDLVDDDQGDPEYAVLTGPITARDVALTGLPPNDDPTANRGSGTPGVVSIMRTVDRAGFIESGDFDVRIILTEEPMGGFTTDKVMVENGSAKSVVKGATYKGGHPLRAEISEYIPGDADATPTIEAVDLPAVDKMDSELGPAMVMYYHAAGDASEAATAVAVADETADNGTIANFPQATGRDNKYHSYIATISPNAGHSGPVTVSVTAFDDNVLPIPNRYVPLTAEQRKATTLTLAAMFVRDARVKNESLTVQVSRAGDTKVVAATAAYKTRQEDVLDKVANEIQLANKAYIPAGGYLVLAADLGKAGIAASGAKLAEKVSAASKLYNTMGLGLPFPASNLDDFFRSGGTLSLGYADITAATGSGHDDAKAVAAADHADNTGYAGATTNAYAAGALIINEIMWGLNGGADPVTGSQYIELHNPGTAAVTIDSKEWVITVGSLPTGYAAIDTVSNNPASGYWAAPGNGGVTVASAANPTVIDLVSMSRVAGGTDGTAAASWAASMLPSANLSGRRIGTPGAANIYVMPAAVAPPPTTPVTPAAPAATAADIMITEIMVGSNDGRLPQWIELANVSAAAVSLSGWSLEIENDSADADVVGASIELDLGDVEIGAGEVALVISKEGRNSGVDTAGVARVKGDANAGNLDADRIIDVKSQVSPTNARYSLISEMGFMISLIPPQTGAVRTAGDVVGNLGGGWELPMSEDGRSSLIRREMDDAAMATMGTDAAGWVLASDTMLSGAYRATYYGSDEDVGTPGFDAGGMLPVELSGFNAARDRVTGAVVITWATQSELNNAGFFIKRSQQQKGKFVVVNPTMIAGAGTTAEKQSYTYTDATADPNVIYYYQIEDVSLDGNRQTLTRAHRLKGHIGAAGKATTTWGDLKSSRD